MGLVALSSMCNPAAAQICERARSEFSCPTGSRSVAQYCVGSCPAGWRDDGWYCLKPDSYSRGTLWIDVDRCHKENQAVDGCEKSWGAWYPKCKKGFVASAATVCSNECPKGMEDIGISCKKPEVTPVCKNPGHEFKRSWIAHCLKSTCPPAMPIKCSGSTCASSQKECAADAKEIKSCPH